MTPDRHALLPLLRERAGASFNQGVRARAEARAFLVGMHRAAMHATESALAGGPPLQAMRVIMVLPGAAGAPLRPRPERERVALEVLPGPQARTGLRLLGGELLRDPYGRLYERGGAGLRPVGSVVAGADGRLYERVDTALERPHGLVEEDDEDASDAVVDVATDDPGPAPDDGVFGRPGHEEDPADDEDEAPAPPPVRRRAAARRRTARTAGAVPRAAAPEGNAEAACPVRALLPAPGKWVQLRHGDFAPLLRSQLAAPERMGADYEMGAWLQVFDSARALAPEDAARWVFGDPSHASALGRWTAEVAHRLGVPLASQDGRRAGGTETLADGLGAGQRFFALRVASDPTTAGGARPPAGGQEGTTRPGHAADGPRRSMPPALLCAVAPTRSRDQAIAAMQQPPAAQGWWQRMLQRPRVSPAARREWQQRLVGRTLDEQLWAVPLPPHGLSDTALREWAQRTLRLAGYELPRMADEWEIFWRCRGATD